MSRKISSIYEYFTIPEEDQLRAVCNICKETISRGGKTLGACTASALKKHLQRRHSDAWSDFTENEIERIDIAKERQERSRDRSEIRQLVTSDTDVTVVSGQPSTAPKVQQKLESFIPWSFENPKQQEGMVLLAEWMASSGLSYNCIENPAFDRFVQFLNRSFRSPSEKTIRKSIMPQMYAKIRSVISSLICHMVDKCSITIDFWTSQSSHAYMSFAIHFIAETWTRKVVTLECLPFDDQHTAANIADALQDVMIDWHLTSKIHLAVTDNGANLVSALNEAGMIRVPCAIHTLQLVVNDCKDKNQTVVDLIKKTSVVVSHFRSSVKSMEVLRKKQKELGIDETVLQTNQQTRWNSEYNMLYSMQINKEAVVAACTELRLPVQKRLDESDWTLLASLVELLKPFRTATLEFEKDAACISEVIPRLVWIEKQLDKVVNTRILLIQLKQLLLERLQFRFYNDGAADTSTREVVYNIEGIQYFTVATTLDPRFRQKFFKAAAHGGAAIDSIKDTIQQLEHEMPMEPSQAASSNRESRRTTAGAGCSTWDGLLDQDEESSSDENEPAAPVSVQEEIDKYLQVKNIDFDADPLIWWKENRAVFPRLAKVAKSYLSAPAGNQSSENAFLVARNVCGGNRGRLLPENTRVLHFLRCNLPAVGFNTFKLPEA